MIRPQRWLNEATNPATLFCGRYLKYLLPGFSFVCQRLFINCAQIKPSMLAGYVLFSIGAVTLFVTIIGAIGLLTETESLSPIAFVSISDCVVCEMGQTAISLFSVEYREVPGRLDQVAIHRVKAGRSHLEVCWPEIDIVRLAPSSTDHRVFIGTRDGSIYWAACEAPTVAPVLVGLHTDRDIRNLEHSPDGRYLLSVGVRDV